MKMNIAVSFIITADVRATTKVTRVMSFVGDPPDAEIILGATLLKTPESSIPRDTVSKDIITAKLSTSIKEGVLAIRE
jgi:hypothetical protein